MGRLVFSVTLALSGFNCCSAAYFTNFEDLPNYAKGGGKELWMGAGVGVSVSMPPMASQVAFKFAQGNPWNGLTINGQSTSRPLTIKDMNGISLGGVSVAVASSTSLNYGSVTLTGSIETLIIGGMELSVDDLSIAAPITTPSICDFNGDAIVDGVDFLRWQRHVGISNATHDKGDADGDHDVDNSDLVAWRYHFGASAASAVELAQSVPEPSAATLCVIAFAALRTSVVSPARRGDIKVCRQGSGGCRVAAVILQH